MHRGMTTIRTGKSQPHSGGTTLRRTVDPVTIASVAPDSVGEAHERVFVPRYSLKNTTRASSASAAILPDPPGYEGRYCGRRASDSGSR
jgi:hypothetical protein